MPLLSPILKTSILAAGLAGLPGNDRLWTEQAPGRRDPHPRLGRTTSSAPCWRNWTPSSSKRPAPSCASRVMNYGDLLTKTTADFLADTGAV